MAKGTYFKSAKIILEDGRTINVSADHIDFDEELENAHVRRWLNPYGCRFWSYLLFLKSPEEPPDMADELE